MEYLIVALALCGFFSAYVAARRGRRPVVWWFVGALLPVLGVVLAMVLPAKPPVRQEDAWAPGSPVPSRPLRRPKRCCGFYIPDCCGCPYFRRHLFDPARAGRTKGRCEFFGKDLDEVPARADSHVAGRDG